MPIPAFKDRYLHHWIVEDLRAKMVFIGGPRQVGKTTLVKAIGLSEYKNPAYLNWDSDPDRKAILASQWSKKSDLIIFDEIHKYRKWKNFIKGEYDVHKEEFHIVVTGSARLDLYQRGGDSMMGRYHYYRLHPFSLAEVLGLQTKLVPFKPLVFPDHLPPEASAVLQRLKTFGGFPEPFLKKDPRTLRRFHYERMRRLIKQDIRDVGNLRDLSALQILADLLPGKVGSLFSLNSLREDLEVTHKTISHWVEVLERFYYHFRIYPFAHQAVRSLHREPKLYLWDWSQVEDKAARLENLVASHLLKMVHFLQDVEGHRTQLWFLREAAGREVDFLVTNDKKPWFCVEVKESADDISKQLLYFKERLKIPFAYQVMGEARRDFIKKGVHFISADKFLTGLV